MEVEFIACPAATQEAIWLRRFLQSLEIVKDVFGPTTVYSDSQVVITYVNNPKYHGRTKHKDKRYYYAK